MKLGKWARVSKCSFKYLWKLIAELRKETHERFDKLQREHEHCALFGRLPCELTLQYNQMWDKPKWSQVSVCFLLMELLFFPAIPHPGYALIYCMLSKPWSLELTTLILFLCSHTFCMLHKCLQNDLHSMPVEIRGSSINLLYSIINLLYLWNYAA